MSTKKELIQQYEDGILKDGGMMAESAFSGIVIVHIEYGVDDKVFGYSFFINSDNEIVKKYFFTRVYYTSRDYFLLNNMRYYMNDFMRKEAV